MTVMTGHKYPIRDVQFHQEGLRMAASHTMAKEEATAVAYHSTAIAYLQFGAFKGVKGPAAERLVDGRVETEPIEDYLLAAEDSHGLTYFQHTFKAAP